MKIAFDVISDLNLEPEESFNWEGKATSLYCIIAGNVSNDLRTIHQTLLHLSKFYQGVFYISGSLEYKNVPGITKRTEELFKICNTIKNVVHLHNHVVIVDGIAILGTNGWYGNTSDILSLTPEEIEIERYNDIGYVSNTIEKLQLHLDVNNIVLVSHSVPGPELFFGEVTEEIEDLFPLQHTLMQDSESKVKHWIYGSYNKNVDVVINDINYINNSYYKRKPYWAKRIEV